jgi:hypothetical protein
MSPMKNILLSGVLMLAAMAAQAQFKKIVVEEVENEGKVPGKTYRIYAELTNTKDQVLVVFGDSLHPLEINSTKPFFQSESGGALSKDIQRSQIESDHKLKFDSWVTIGSTDNYDNSVNLLNLNFKEFESGTRTSIKTKDGAWFCIPTEKQTVCKEDKKILLMQLTTPGEVTGNISLMGKTATGVTYTNHNIRFSCGGKK